MSKIKVNTIDRHTMKKTKNKIKRSCGEILVKDGCPSYCDIPHNKSRKSCVVKSRRRKMKRMKEENIKKLEGFFELLENIMHVCF